MDGTAFSIRPTRLTVNLMIRHKIKEPENA